LTFWRSRSRYEILGEGTLEAFYEGLQPFAGPFMALFGRARLPSRSALSRFLSALSFPAVEALRRLFLDDLLARPLVPEGQTGELLDRCGASYLVFDIDGTREAARQRALPTGEERPVPQRRLEELCAPGYTGRKRGEVVRTRTVVSQAHSYQWLGSFGNPGNDHSRDELRRAVEVIGRYLQAHQLPKERTLLRLDGQYGTGAVLADLAGFAFVTRGKDSTVLDHPLVQTRLHLPADASFARPESTLVRTLYDCPGVPVGPDGCRCRVVVATHPAGQTRRRIGLTRQGVVYELFFTNLPQQAFTPADVVALYLHRGAFEPALSDEDQELDPDRWWSHAPAGQECWQLIAQWLWNLRLELGHVLKREPVRTTAFAPAFSPSQETPSYEPPVVGGAWKAGRFSGRDFALQPDGTVRCPAGKPLVAQECRREADGSLRVVYAARIAACRACPLREQCQWHGQAARHPRRVSALLHPRKLGSSSLLWKDRPRRAQRRACMELLRHQRVDVRMPQRAQVLTYDPAVVLTRSQRAHARLSWEERLARHARASNEAPPTITLFGVPAHLATFLGLKAV
jgi:hypothetical protein